MTSRHAHRSSCRARAPLAFAIALASCSSGALVDQAYYEQPDVRGIRVTQVVLRGADDEATPDELDRVGYNRYARATSASSPDTILVMIAEWGRGAGWLDALARDLVAAEERLEVWTLNRRQALFAALGARAEDFAFLRRWDLALAQRDLQIVCDEARARGARLALGGWGLVGSLQAYAHVRTSADATPLFLLDAWLAPRNSGERSALAGMREAVRAQLDSGALTAVGLDPRVRPSTPGDFAFVEQAAFEAQRAPEAESELVAHHPALASSARRFTNRALFAWSFDRPRPRRCSEELAQRGPLAGLQGIACAELERREDGRGSIDDAHFGAACGAPYELEETLAPFDAPGGPFEAFAPITGWIDALDRIPALEAPASSALFGSILMVETALQRDFRARVSRERDADGAEDPARVFGQGAAPQRLMLQGDETAPLLAAEIRAQLLAAMRAWLAQR